MRDPVVLAYGDRDYRRSELSAGVNGLARVLADHGVRPGHRVALMSSNRPEFVMALLAVWQLGAAIVLISPAWKRADVAAALALTRPQHAIGDQPVLAEAMPAMFDLDTPFEPHPQPVTGTAAADPDTEAVLVFSSGTTGLPKAVRHTHRGFAAAVEHWRDALQLGETDRLQILTPASHILGLLNIVTVLESGGWLRLHARFDVDAMLRHIQDDRITVEMAVAPIALAIAAHPDLESYDLSSLRYLMWCATPVTVSVAEQVTRRTGVRWTTAYGASELPVLTCNDLVDGPLDTVGRAVPGVRLRVVSLDDGRELAAGESGEIQAQADSLMSGYLPAAATAEVIDADGWYRTGDIGHLDDRGYLRITDRSKEMIKVRGFQVAPAEVEAVLHEHPAIADCAVYGVPHDRDGEAVVAAVAIRPDAGAVAPDALRALVEEQLASYKRPSEIVFVPEIPRLPSGKVLRRVLKERHGCTSDH